MPCRIVCDQGKLGVPGPVAVKIHRGTGKFMPTPRRLEQGADFETEREALEA